mgnify:CR=1 FL=1
MNEIDIALSRLNGVKKMSGGYQATCPCHDDQHQSLSVSEKEGKFLAYCHAGCSFESIIKALDLRRDRTNDTPTITATYDYTDAEGKLLYQVVRYHPKAFKQRRPDGGGWVWDLKGITPTLYHLPEVIKSVKDGKSVFIVEGEKDVETLEREGYYATTISGGASTKWHPSLVPLFEGAKVTIIPDNDEAGRKYAHYVADLLYGWCLSLKFITLPCKDVSDYLETKTVDNLLQIVYNTSEYVPTGVVTREEFTSFRGVNLYLWRVLRQRKPKRKPKYD